MAGDASARPWALRPGTRRRRMIRGSKFAVPVAQHHYRRGPTTAAAGRGPLRRRAPRDTNARERHAGPIATARGGRHEDRIHRAREHGWADGLEPHEGRT